MQEICLNPSELIQQGMEFIHNEKKEKSNEDAFSEKVSKAL